MGPGLTFISIIMMNISQKHGPVIKSQESITIDTIDFAIYFKIVNTNRGC